MDEPWIGSDRLAATKEGWVEKEAERQIFNGKRFDEVAASAGAQHQGLLAVCRQRANGLDGQAIDSKKVRKGDTKSVQAKGDYCGFKVGHKRIGARRWTSCSGRAGEVIMSFSGVLTASFGAE